MTELTNRRNEEGAESIAVENRFRYSNVRDITELDFYIRGVSPITNEAFRQCTSNPLFNCSVNNDFECNQDPGGNSPSTPTFLFDSPATNLMCPLGSNCSGAINVHFDTFDLVKETTSDASPICRALLGPIVDSESIKEPNYDQCSLLFDLDLDLTGASTYDYGNMVDIRCNQRSRALMCTMLGILLTSLPLFRDNTP